ncbi:MAG: heme-binding protein, partial [Nocardia sp.]|nr:heme-binding protein [Nocardia sp.]
MALRDHQPSRQIVSKFRRQRQPPFVVQSGGVGTEEHLGHLPTGFTSPYGLSCSARPTLPHFPPLSIETWNERLCPVPGGLPIFDAEGALTGAIGVAGGTPSQDV